MANKPRLLKKYTLVFLGLVIVFSLIISGISLFSLNGIFSEQLKDYQSKFVEQNKDMIHSRVQIALGILKHFYAQTMPQNMQQTMQRNLKVLAELSAKSLIAEYQDELSREPEQALRNHLLQLVSNLNHKSGKFWLLDANGTLLYYPRLKNWQGKNVSQFLDADGRTIFQEVLNQVKQTKQGSLVFKFFDSKTKKVQSYCTYFVKLPMFNWILGADSSFAYYHSLLTKHYQRIALNALGSLRFGQDSLGYFFVLDGNYKILVHPRDDLIGQVLPRSLSLNVQKLLANQDKGFLFYKWPKLTQNVLVDKMAYLVRFKPWNWILGTSVYLDDIEKDITFWQNSFIQKQVKIFWVVGLSFFAFILFVGWIFYRLSKGLIFVRLTRLKEILDKIVQGRLKEIKSEQSQNRDDEIGEIEQGLCELGSNLRFILQQLSNGLEQLKQGKQFKVDKSVLQGCYQEILVKIEKILTEFGQSITKLETLAKSLEQGQLGRDWEDSQAVIPAFRGVWTCLLETRKHLADTIMVLREIISHTEKGEFYFELEVRKLPGIYQKLVEDLEDVVANFVLILEEISLIAEQVAQGNLEVKINLEQFAGSYQDIFKVLDKIISQLKARLSETQNFLNREQELTRLKELIEGDKNIDDAYERIKILLANKFALKAFRFYEIGQSGHKMETVIKIGEEEKDFCVEQIDFDRELCRAQRTGELIENKGYSWGNVCEFMPEQAISWCLPFVGSKGVRYVLQILGAKDDPEELARIENRLSEIKTYINVLVPILEAKRLVASLQEKSLKDGLTLLYNRYFLDEYIVKTSELARRNQTNLTVFMLDIDFFKQVNDEFGHDAGDEVLRQMASLFLGSVRSSDVVVRYGGEEFLILLHDVDEDFVLYLAEQIRTKVEQHTFHIQNTTISKTISIGIAVFPDDAGDIWQVVKYADIALYYAKKTGRNKVVRFEPFMLEWEKQI